MRAIFVVSTTKPTPRLRLNATWCILITIRPESCRKLLRETMADTSSRPQVNGILETSLYVERPAQSVELYRRVFGFEPIDTDQREGISDETRLCAMRA